MNATPPPLASIVFPQDAPVVTAFGDCATFHLTGAQTGGRCTMFTSVTPPGGGPPPHRHENEDEWFLVLEGRAEFFHDGKWTEVSVGGSVFMQRGTVHNWVNKTNEVCIIAFVLVSAAPVKINGETLPPHG